MRNLQLLFLLMLSGLVACSTQKKSQSEINPEPVVIESEGILTETNQEILEKEEVIIEEPGEEVSINKYYVIIGSFSMRENALQHQEDIAQFGFISELLKNQEGLYRVSVLGTNEEQSARQEILRIRKNYPEYNDTWLLIRIKQGSNLHGKAEAL